MGCGAEKSCPHMDTTLDTIKRGMSVAKTVTPTTSGIYLKG
jgi:hypothetical protein